MNTAHTEERLSKRVAALKGCSRREAEQYIEGGWVSVNGHIVEEPQARVTHHTVDIDPHASLMALTDVTFILNKPPGMLVLPERTGERSPLDLITPATQLAQGPRGQRLLRRHLQRLVCPVPLETGASGLIVYTQEWRVQRKLEEDASSLEHEVIVEVAGEVAEDGVRHLRNPMGGGGQSLPEFKVSVNSSGDGKTKLRFAVKGAHPGLIAWLCDRSGLQILGMKRIRVGRVALAGLPVGQWRFLVAEERF
ncbi:MAG: hypothetical protein RL459_166 [Pseudomonadota bacterium]